MKRFLSIFSALTLFCFFLNAQEVSVTSGEDSLSVNQAGSESYYVYLSSGGVDAYDIDDMDGNYYVQGEFTCFALKSGEVFYYTAQEFDSISTVAPVLPEFTSYKFNNKFNPNLNIDAIADSVAPEMNFSLNAIGKWLTASFQLSDDKAVVYIDTVLQESKVTRQSFAEPKVYTVTYPGYNKIKAVKVSDEEWDQAGSTMTEVPLNASMLSTNKPSAYADEGLGNLLDGISSTIFHSTWGEANNATVNVNTYIDIALPTSLENFKLYYQCRPQDNYAPLELEIYASNNGSSWNLVRTLTSADGMPTGVTTSVSYTSPTISLGGSYSYLRIIQTRGQYSKNHMVLAEMRIYEVELGESSLISGATYKTKRVPFGREYKVNVDWLVDNAYSVPRIDIDIDGGEFVTSKDYYLNANFRITGYGVYDDFQDSVQIKGRGNVTWSYPKKPYRLKFASKVKPFGLTKGKSWVLLANAQDGSMMANAVAMKIAQMVGAEYSNHIIPVEVYMNGYYMGSYMFTEKVGLANNSVDVDEELGYLLELDSYYDETYKFYSKYYNLPVNIKEPDLSEYTSAAAANRKALISTDFNALDEAVLNGGDLSSILDIEAFARFMLTNDLVCNQEIGHPKSCYLFKEELENPESKIKFGPAWDFDWGFGYESTRDYCTSDYTSSVLKGSMANSAGYKFFSALMDFESVQKYYYKVWTEFLDKNSIEELKDYMDCYYNFARTSFENNYYVWGDGLDYATINNRMQNWVSNRANYLYSNLTEYNLDEFIYPLGDVNQNKYLTVHDIAMITAYRNGFSHESFVYSMGDVNGDELVMSDDIALIEEALLSAEAIPSIRYYEIPKAIGGLQASEFNMVLYENCNLPINLVCSDGETYKAVQMDVTLPDGVLLLKASAGSAISGHKIAMSQLDMQEYRIVIYSNTNKSLKTGDAVLVNLELSNYSEIAEEDCKIEIKNIIAVDELVDEVRMDNVEVAFSLSESAAIPGDVTGDGDVNVSDVTKVVAMILNPSIVTTAGDVTGDGDVNVSDVTRVVSIILGSSNNAPARAAATRAAVMSTISAESDGEAMFINVNNPEFPFTAIQFDLYLGEGATLADGEDAAVVLGNRTADGCHTAPAYALQPDGALRVAIFSGYNALFAGTDGTVAKINLDAEAGYKYEIKNVVLSDPESNTQYLSNSTGFIAGGVTAIDRMVADDKSNAEGAVYDLSGRKVKNPAKNGIYIKNDKKYIAD